MKKILLLFLLSGFCTFGVLCERGQAESNPFSIKFATVAPEGSAWMKQMRRLDKTLREKSGGSLGFRLYAGGVAGDELDVLRKIRISQIHSAAFSGVGFGQILPMVRVLDLPFLFRNDRETDLVHKELRSFFAEQFRKKGFELLAWAEVGKVHIFSKHPIQNMEDFARRKIWTWTGDPIAEKTFSAMGASPIPLSITDVTTALNTGMIDTVYAPPLGALALQWHRSLKFMTLLPLAHPTGAVLLSSKLFNRMPINLSRLLKQETEKAMIKLTSELRIQTRESVKLLERSGLTILPMPDAKHLQEFFRVHEKVAQAFVDKIYSLELLERVYGILDRAR